MAELCFGLAGLFFLLSIHPYTFYPLSLWLMPRTPLRVPAPGWTRPTIAICMSAYNEERVIEAKVESLLAMVADYGPASINIYVDGSADRTAELLEPYRDRITLIVSETRRGKTAGLKELLAGIDAEVLAFTDANVQVPPDSLTKLAAALQDPDVCCASARLTYSNAAETGVSASGTLYWNLEEFIKSLETQTVGLMGVDGALFLIERSAYSPPSDELIDDLYVSVSALLTGKRVVSAQSVTVEERGASLWHEEFHRKVRISCQAINVHRALWPRLRRAPPAILYCYMSHRFLKWMTPFSLSLTAAALLVGLGLTIGWLPVLLAMVILPALLALGAWINIPMFRLVLGALVSLSGVAWGILVALLTARTFATWTPAATVRD
ncbi:hypothetical protein BH10PSE5_BH10PSE5_03340 [soil metagenome]